MTGAGRGLLISMMETQQVLFDWSKDTGSTGSMDGSVLVEKSSFKMLGLTLSSKLDWGSYMISIVKTLQGNWSLDMFNEVSFS